MNQAIQDFIQARRIAIVGVSRTAEKFGYAAFVELRRRGYEVFIVHPEAKEIAGTPCYPNLSALQGQVDGALVCVPPDQAEGVVREAVQIGLKNIWLQSGVETPELVALAQNLGVTPVAGKCILMYAPPVRGFHGLHRGFVKLFGHLE